MKIAISKVVKAKREDVFKVWTDYENMPRWSKAMKTVKVVSAMKNTLKLEWEGEFFGKRFKATEIDVLAPPTKVIEEWTTEDGTTYKAIVTFAEWPG